MCIKYTRPTSLPDNDAHIELELISDPLPDISDWLSPQIIQKIFKASGVNFSKCKHYKHCKAKHHSAAQATKITLNNIKIHFCLSIYKYNTPSWLTTSHTWSCQSGTLTQILPLYFGISSVSIHNQHNWPHWPVTHKLQTWPNHKGLASLHPNFLIF